jgi:hypothetical protein
MCASTWYERAEESCVFYRAGVAGERALIFAHGIIELKIDFYRGRGGGGGDFFQHW